MKRLLLILCLPLILANGQCGINITNPDKLPMARGFGQKEYRTLSGDYNDARIAVLQRRCQETLTGKDDGTLHKLLRMAIFLHARELPGADDFCVRNGFLAFAIPKANVVVICRAYFGIPETERVITLIHESIHLVGLSHKDVKEYDTLIWKGCVLALRNSQRDNDMLTPQP